MKININISNRNFFISCGALALLITIVGALFIYPLLLDQSTFFAETERIRTELEAISLQPTTIYGQKDVKAVTKLTEELENDYKSMIHKLIEKDQTFERWFKEAYTDNQGSHPSLKTGKFSSTYGDEMSKLETKLKRMGPDFQIGYASLKDDSDHTLALTLPGMESPGNFGETSVAHLSRAQFPGGDLPEETLHALQKRFWLRQMTVNAILNSDLRISRLSDIVFFTEIENIKYENQKRNLYFNNGSRTSSHITSENLPIKNAFFKKEENPISYGKTIPFGIVLAIEYSDIPAFINYLTSQARPDIPELDKNGTYTGNSEKNHGIFIDILKWEIRQTKMLPSTIAKTFKKGEEIDMAVVQKLYKDTRAHPVTLILQCEAFDFDQDKLKEALKYFEPPEEIEKKASK